MKKLSILFVILLCGISPVFSAHDIQLEKDSMKQDEAKIEKNRRIPHIQSQVCSKTFDETSTQWGSNCVFYAPRSFSEKQRIDQLIDVYHYFSCEFKARFGGDVFGDFDAHHLSGYSIQCHDAYKYLFSNAKVAWELIKMERKDPYDTAFSRTIIDEKLQDRLNPTLQMLLLEMSVDGFF